VAEALPPPVPPSGTETVISETPVEVVQTQDALVIDDTGTSTVISEDLYVPPEPWSFTNAFITTPWNKGTARLMGTDIPKEDMANIFVDLTRLPVQIIGGYYGGKTGAEVASRIAAPIKNPILRGGVTAAGGLTGMVAGSVLGHVAPEAVFSTADLLNLGALPGVPDDLMDKYGMSPEWIRTVMEGEAVLELMSLGAFGVIRQTGRTGTRLFTKMSEAGTDLAERAAVKGLNLMPVQLGDREIPRMYVSVFGRFPFVSTPFRRVGKELQESSLEYLKSARDRTGFNLGNILPHSELGEKVIKEGQELLDGFLTAWGRQYDRLAQVAIDKNIYVIPDALVKKGEEILEFARKGLPVNQAGEVIEGARNVNPSMMKQLEKFLEDTILPMRTSGAQIGQDSVPQTLNVSKAIDSSLDEFLAKFDEPTQRFISSQVEQLRQALALDMTENVRQFAAPVQAALQAGRGLPEMIENSDDVVRFLEESKALDLEMSSTLSQLFETQTANRYARFIPGGMRGRGAALERVTQADYSEVARSVLNRNSTRSIDNFYDLVQPETFDDAVASVLNEAFYFATKVGGKGEEIFSPALFMRRLGLDRSPNSQQYQNLAYFLNKSKRFDMGELEELGKVFNAMGSVEIPNVSTFVARRVQLAGIKALMPWAAAGGVHAATGLTSAILMLGSGRLLSASLANPLNARLLRNVLAEEGSLAMQRNNMVRIIGNGMRALYEASAQDDEAKASYLEQLGLKNEFAEAMEQAVNHPLQFAADAKREVDEFGEPYQLQNLTLEAKNFLLQAITPEEDPESEEEDGVPLTRIAPPPLPITETVPGPAAQFTDPNLLAAAQQMAAPAPAPAPPAGGGVDSAMRKRYASLYPNDMVSELIGQGVGSLPA